MCAYIYSNRPVFPGVCIPTDVFKQPSCLRTWSAPGSWRTVWSAQSSWSPQCWMCPKDEVATRSFSPRLMPKLELLGTVFCNHCISVSAGKPLGSWHVCNMLYNDYCPVKPDYNLGQPFAFVIPTFFVNGISKESKAPKCRAGCPTRRCGAACDAGRSPSDAPPFPPWSSPVRKSCGAMRNHTTSLRFPNGWKRPLPSFPNGHFVMPLGPKLGRGATPERACRAFSNSAYRSHGQS